MKLFEATTRIALSNDSVFNNVKYKAMSWMTGIIHELMTSI